MMTAETTMKIKAFAKDPQQAETLEALMNYYGKTNLMQISEEQALAFLHLLERGEICNG